MTNSQEEITTSEIIDRIHHKLVFYVVRAKYEGVPELPGDVERLLEQCMAQLIRLEEELGEMVDTTEQLAQQVEAMEEQIRAYQAAQELS